MSQHSFHIKNLLFLALLCLVLCNWLLLVFLFGDFFIFSLEVVAQRYWSFKRLILCVKLLAIVSLVFEKSKSLQNSS